MSFTAAALTANCGTQRSKSCRLLGAKLRGDVSPEGLQRAQGYLLRRGYSWDDIRAATERYLSGKDTP